MTDIVYNDKNRGKLDDTLAAMFSNAEFRTNYLFYAHMIGQCSIKIRTDLPASAGVAFAVDHYNLYINPTMFDKFSVYGRLAILKHEMLHILYGHLGERIQELDHKDWNYATDCAINQHIDSAHLPDCGIMPAKLEEALGVSVPNNKSAEYYYNLLKKNKPEDSDEQNGDGEKQDGDGQGNSMESMDSHDVWNESEGDPDLQDTITKKMIEQAQEETIKSKGNVPSECADWLAMFNMKAELNWKKVLRGIVGNRKIGRMPTIKRKDRRMPHRPDLKGKTKTRTFNLLLVGDVSGSMCDKAVLQTFSEVRHVCDITKTDVNLIQIDTQAYEPEKLSKKTKMVKRKGHGGTELNSALLKAKEHNIEFDAVIVLTDGGLFGDDIGCFKRLNKKVIWLIESSGYIMDEMNTGKMQAFKLKGAV